MDQLSQDPELSLSSIGTAMMVLRIFPIDLLTLVVLAVIIVILYLLCSKSDNESKLYYAKSHFTDFIVSRCSRISSPFCPTLWAQNKHVQTLISGVQAAADVKFDRELVELSDGGCCAIDWLIDCRPQATPDKGCNKHNMPVLIVLPGLTGDAMSMSHLCKRAADRGYRPVVFNKRGHGGSKLKTPKVQSFGDPKDLYVIVKHIQTMYPDSVLTAVGASAGSGLLASYLGEYGQDCLLSYGVFISPGYDTEFLFTHCIKNPYNFLLMWMLKKVISNNKDVLGEVVDMDKVMQAKNLISLEEELYCTLHGYPSMDEYWKHNNPVRQPGNIAIPLLAISSVDDPVCTKECINHNFFTETIRESILVTTRRGGHCGFLEGWRLEHWADKLALDYLDTCMQYPGDTCM